MPYIDADTYHRLLKSASSLRRALDDDERNSAAPEIVEALNGTPRIWLESWIMPPLDQLLDNARGPSR
jgi:hypothetical protein